MNTLSFYGGVQNTHLLEGVMYSMYMYVMCHSLNIFLKCFSIPLNMRKQQAYRICILESGNLTLLKSSYNVEL